MNITVTKFSDAKNTPVEGTPVQYKVPLESEGVVEELIRKGYKFHIILIQETEVRQSAKWMCYSSNGILVAVEPCLFLKEDVDQAFKFLVNRIFPAFSNSSKSYIIVQNADILQKNINILLEAIDKIKEQIDGSTFPYKDIEERVGMMDAIINDAKESLIKHE